MRIRLLVLLCAISYIGLGQSFHTLTIDGNNDFVSSTERFSTTSGTSLYGYVTWDTDYIYIGFSGNSPAGPITDSDRNYHIYIDTDPNETPTAGTGTVNGEPWRFTPALPFSANIHYIFKSSGNQEFKRAYVNGNWVDSSFSTSNWKNTTASYWEVRIKRSDLNNPTRINLIAYVEEDWSPGAQICGGIPSNLFTNGTGNPVTFTNNYLHFPLFDQLSPNSSFHQNNFLWKIKLKAAVNGVSDTTALAGMAKNATNGYDTGIDLAKAPTPPSNYVEVYFPHSDWSSVLGNRYARDFRQMISLNTTTSVWDFSVNTDKVNSTVTLSFSDFANIPSNYDIKVKDLTTSTEHNVRIGGNYTYSSGASGGERQFKLIIGITLGPPNITVNNNALDFGSVKLSKDSTINVVVTNTGDSALVISNINSNNSAFTFTGPANNTILTNASDTIKVKFTPTALQTYNGTLNIASNSGTNSSLNISLTGAGIALPVVISTSVSTVSYGSVKVTKDSTKTFKVYNTGEGTLNVDSANSSDAAFTVTSTVPFSVSAGDSATMSVKFSPTQAQPYNATLTLKSNATNNASLQVALEGIGTALEPIGNVSPDSLAYGNVVVGKMKDLTFALSNTGDAVLTVTQLNFSNGGFSYRGTLPVTVNPGSSVNISVRFKPAAVTAYSSTLAIISNNVAALSVKFSGTGTKLTDSVSVAAGWSLLSVPANADNPTASAVFGDDFVNYLLYGYTNSGGYITSDTIKTGRGYWLGVENSGVLDVTGTANVGNIEVPLNSGWNLLASPFVSGYAKSDLYFRKNGSTVTAAAAADSGWIQNVFYKYSSGAYSSADTLSVWSGYWLSALMADVYTVFREDSTLSRPVEMILPDEPQISVDDWYVQIKASQNTQEDLLLAFGAHNNATDGFDAKYDYAKPPVSPAPNAIETYFEQTAWNNLFTKYGSDIRAKFVFPAPGKSWSFKVRAKTAGMMTLSWSSINQQIPEEIRNKYFFLLSSQGLVSGLNMLSVPSFSFNAEAGAVYTFTINSTLTAIGDEAGLPQEYSLGQNYPNPFNPATAIRYDVKESGHVSIKVFDMIGNEVATLVNETKPAGRYEVSFDASALASGVYLYKMQAGSFNLTRKLVLMK